MPYAKARKLVGPDAIIGVTCHNSRHLALEAGDAGADYVAFGAFFPTDTKDASTRAEPDLLTWWQQMIELPCVAIGGITVNNAKPLVEAGADFLAVSAGVWRTEGGPGAAVAAFNAIFHIGLLWMPLPVTFVIASVGYDGAIASLGLLGFVTALVLFLWKKA
jgi:thiamine-phosphate pyrophosphorylase